MINTAITSTVPRHKVHFHVTPACPYRENLVHNILGSFKIMRTYHVLPINKYDCKSLSCQDQGGYGDRCMRKIFKYTYRYTEILTFGRFPNSGFSKHPHLSAHKILVTSGTRQSICLAKPQGESLINTGGGYFKDK